MNDAVNCSLMDAYAHGEELTRLRLRGVTFSLGCGLLQRRFDYAQRDAAS